MCIENEVQTNHLKASNTYNILICIYIYVDLFDLYCYAGTMPRNNPSLLQLAKIGQQLLMILHVWPCRSILCSVSQQLVLVVTFVKVVRGIQLGKIGSKSTVIIHSCPLL